MRIFDEGIALINDNGYYGPKEFLTYCEEIGLNRKKIKTADYISLDYFENLPKELKDSDVMVLRMGGGQKTSFVLFTTGNNLRNFFLHDGELFDDIFPKTFMPRVEMRELIPYYLMPTRSETTFVNFALSTGVFHKALGLDGDSKITMPATGRSNFTFDLKIHSLINKIFHHKSGQVEIDGIFLGQREGQDCIFVLEAKNSKKLQSLSKHKLVYPILSIAQSVPTDIKIIPIYMKSVEHKDYFEFKIAECNFPDPRQELEGINKLEAINHYIYRVPKINF